ncbi:MAG: hypothetical protein ACP5IM_06215 [Candidatus Bathyarchaeia archaeon]|nr:MAG: hypothetical protein C0195_01775 [Candidatus Bathyarchaeota archaeon]
MKMPKVWEILEKFKNLCRLRGWKTSENEDLIEVGDEYHNFLYARDVHPSSFKKIASSGKCVVREGLSYKIVEPSYTAWLFLEPPSKVLLRTVFENPEFAEQIALYDLSPLLEGKNSCTKLNMTESVVFQEFEHFLENELNVKVQPIRLSDSQTLLNDIAVEN